MSVARDFMAPRNARMQNIAVVTVYCDAPKTREGHCQTTFRGVTAAEARQEARAAGWKVNQPGQYKGRRRDYCPEHAGA
ncbi:hypothetical protein QDA00_gp90 [Microbacterium phage Matzah]|uniref:Uncharacterized protein n=1 Tax=Microbacterium phage Matzah TaxID=2686228 RepID=A0A6B9L8U8_9CAUD|nr:hypothetical protein QDA00_gp90 [Microbacterium phage Matzah]QHB37013.1 hypothetical protein SEA_MATZAH_20 [Microbacterium phage Matzah]